LKVDWPVMLFAHMRMSTLHDMSELRVVTGLEPE
jgi:hypothetical protein